jgi:HPt (histidine-containing phosphotransfer) domain-containing protein
MSSINPRVISDLRELEQAGAPGFVAELIDLFLKEAIVHLARLRDSLKNKDASLFARAAHTMKGSSGNLGAMTLSHICAELQDLGPTVDWSRAAEILPRLETEFEAVKAELLLERGRT